MRKVSSLHPRTGEEWDSYLASLTDAELQIQARAANTLEFVKKMSQEGYSPVEISDIFENFAQEMYSRDLLVPERGEGSYLSYRALLRDVQEG